MIHRIVGQLPEWAQPDHPFIRYAINRGDQAYSRRDTFLRLLLICLLLAVAGFLMATNLLQQEPGVHPTDSLWRILFFPTVGVQVVLWIMALSMGVNMVSDERRRQTWDKLRATEMGAGLALRTQWVSIFYRLRVVILALMLVRVVLILGMLYDLTAFRGDYLNMLTAPVLPDFRAAGVVLLAFTMTASILLPIVGIGLAGALGLLISIGIKQRSYAATVQLLLVIFMLVLVGGSLMGVTVFVQGDLPFDEPVPTLLVGSLSVLASWGMLFLQLGAAGELWAQLPLGIYLGVILSIVALLLALMTDGLLNVIVRLSERE